MNTSLEDEGDVERDEKGNGLLPACYMTDENPNHDRYTFCDIKGNLMNDYKYNTISHFRKGIACVTYDADYDDELALIDNSGKTLVKFSEYSISEAVCEEKCENSYERNVARLVLLLVAIAGIFVIIRFRK